MTTPPVDLDTLDRSIAAVTATLLARRTPAGHWEGQLSTSALSTATAVIALAVAGRARASSSSSAGGLAPLVARGLDWLATHQNDDGGWGDTVRSTSNLSTTALGWAAMAFDADARPACRAAEARARTWLVARAGSIEPEPLAAAVVNRYGKDRTFSVPILTVLALAGRLGDGVSAWRRVPQLPFELAVLPHRWFEFVRLPVVSYALPALIAIGQARHEQAPTRNLPMRAVRSAVRRSTLAALGRMQPSTGGYLEATPLTSFVVMSLVAAGKIADGVVEHGVRFLVDSIRDDGGWPIDTNLATWVTTLSVDALPSATLETRLGAGDQRRIVDWLLGQQYREEHPFTHAAPGGWAWTDLPGGVPDADDTAGALLALRRLAPDDADARRAAAAGTTWLLDLQNRDGGIPTFCRGWGALPFDRSTPDLTAHALQAWSAWESGLEAPVRARVAAAARRAVRYLASCQRGDGSWSPLWFGNEAVADEENLTFGTSRVVSALHAPLVCDLPDVGARRARGVAWLLAAQQDDGGWGGGPGAAASIEETGLAVRALAGIGAMSSAPEAVVIEAVGRGAVWLSAHLGDGSALTAAPIGLYFARLWYFEDLYPLVFGLGGLVAARARLTAR